MPTVNTRAFFSKTGRAKYISHLDLSGVVIRAMKLAKLPVWQTEGFNPRTYVTFMLPLSLGQESICEAMDFRLTEDVPFDEVRDRLNKTLPPDIRVNKVAVPKDKNTDITAASYEITLTCDTAKLSELLSREQLLTEKKTKKGVAEIDLKPLISDVEITGNTLYITLPAGNTLNINPMLIFEALSKETGEKIKPPCIIRTKIFSGNRGFE